MVNYLILRKKLYGAVLALRIRLFHNDLIFKYIWISRVRVFNVDWYCFYLKYPTFEQKTLCVLRLTLFNACPYKGAGRIA